MHEKLFASLLLPLMLGLVPSAQAVDFTWSGFGTLGYAQSDASFKYQRFVNDGGTLNRDSILGAQVDLKFDQHWGAAVQVKAAPSEKSDSNWQGFLSWAFVSWRPADDWLIRAGKLRVPLMLNTENQDVGMTYDLARLPLEVYSIVPTTDFVGLSLSKSWFVDNIEWTVDAYSGRAQNYTRYYGREIKDGGPSAGSWFQKLSVKSSGLVLSVHGIDNMFRAGVHEAEVTQPGGFISEIPYKSIAPGIGYYDIASGRSVDRIFIPVQNIGVSLLMPGDVRLTGEYARMKVTSASRGFTRWGSYLSVSRQFGAWTPYVYYAKVKSTDAALGLYKTVDSNTNPLLGSGINDYQKLAADIVSPFDQWTGALGTSYRLTPRSMLKAEWSHIQTGVASNFVDAPSGSESGNRHFNVFSLSYSFTF